MVMLWSVVRESSKIWSRLLHSAKLLRSLHIFIENKIDVLNNAEWIIDLGPEGGEEGGRVIAEGTVHDIIVARKSYTGQWLKK